MKDTRGRAWVVLLIIVGAVAVTSVARLMTGTHAAGAGLISWNEDLAAARKQSAASGKPLLVYFTSQSCSYCRALEREAWSDARVAAAIDASYTPVKIDVDANRDIAMQYHVMGYPRVDLLVGDGMPITLATGYLPADEMLARLQPAPATTSSNQP